VTRLNYKLISLRLEIVPISTQDRCTVSAKRTIGSKIVFDALEELLGDVGLVESRYGLFGGVVSVSAR
jgi:hypothetical protein